jgi:hypothetical protein
VQPKQRLAKPIAALSSGQAMRAWHSRRVGTRFYHAARQESLGGISSNRLRVLSAPRSPGKVVKYTRFRVVGYFENTDKNLHVINTGHVYNRASMMTAIAR